MSYERGTPVYLLVVEVSALRLLDVGLEHLARAAVVEVAARFYRRGGTCKREREREARERERGERERRERDNRLRALRARDDRS